MKIPVRLVCRRCGRSVEGDGDQPQGTAIECRDCVSARGYDHTMGAGVWEAGSAGVAAVESPPSWSAGSDRKMPDLVARFRPRAVLGGGGFGQVYLAYDPRLERDVALKVLKELRPVTRVEQRFFREARAAAQLDHPNIVALHDAGRESGVCWIAYQYIAGTTLSRYRDEHSIDAPRAVGIVLALADALDHAHQRGVYHRDLKPANILIDLAGCPRLTDFGLARRVDVDPTMTRDGAILGTPAYMSPEQAAGQSHRADARSDVYSLGVIFKELLTGRRATVPTTPAHPRGSEPAPTPSARPRDRSLPRALDCICNRALAADPANRYPDARAFANDLETWLCHRAYWARLRRRAAMAGILLVAAGIVAADALAPRGNATKAPAPATTGPGIVVPTIPRMTVKNSIAIPEAASSAAVFVEKGKHFIHLMHCSASTHVPGSQRYTFSSTNEAQKKGYIPCVSCKPK